MNAEDVTYVCAVSWTHTKHKPHLVGFYSDVFDTPQIAPTMSTEQRIVHMPQAGTTLAKRSCQSCKLRKRKCTRELPECRLCVRSVQPHIIIALALRANRQRSVDVVHVLTNPRNKRRVSSYGPLGTTHTRSKLNRPCEMTSLPCFSSILACSTSALLEVLHHAE